jgi:V/A-type H+/Na+-transporting ATPase subunit I
MSPERVEPVAMARVAAVVPRIRLRDALVVIAAAGDVELETLNGETGGEAAAALARLEHKGLPAGAEKRLAVAADIARWEERRQLDLLGGEVDCQRRADAAVTRNSSAVLLGWMPRTEMPGLDSKLSGLGGAIVELQRPRWEEPPTLLSAGTARDAFHSLVETYGVVRYADIDPTLFAAITFCVMFGMMFGDVGHGLLLSLGAVLIRLSTRPWLATVRRLWLIPLFAGLAAAAFGCLYGEVFGPTGLIRPLWLAPLSDPQRLLLAALAVGAFFLAASFVVASINRVRESGVEPMLLSTTGGAGFLIFMGGASLFFGIYGGISAAVIAGIVAMALGLLLATAGLLTKNSETAPGGKQSVWAQIPEVIVTLFDAVIRTFTNSISFVRLAAFGIVHAALLQIVWTGTTALMNRGAAAAVVAAVVFLLGNVLAFSIEAFVAGIQALRLEYYELFSRIYGGVGRRFAPWSLPIVTGETAV